MDIIRVYKSNKNMTDVEKQDHIKKLANERQKRAYRKKKIEQFKLKQQQEPPFTIKKIGCDDIDIEDVEDVELLPKEEVLEEIIKKKPKRNQQESP
jgi:hypothetical protein